MIHGAAAWETLHVGTGHSLSPHGLFCDSTPKSDPSSPLPVLADGSQVVGGVVEPEDTVKYPGQHPFLFDVFQLGCLTQTPKKWPLVVLSDPSLVRGGKGPPATAGPIIKYRCPNSAACKMYVKTKTPTITWSCEEFCRHGMDGAVCLHSWGADSPMVEPEGPSSIWCASARIHNTEPCSKKQASDFSVCQCLHQQGPTARGMFTKVPTFANKRNVPYGVGMLFSQSLVPWDGIGLVVADVRIGPISGRAVP